jgi:hypothetical protein
MKFSLVNFDEVFVKLKEIENPGHAYDFVPVWVAGRGWSDQKKSKNGKTSFFAPRVVVLTGAPPVPAAGTCGSAGTPGGIQGVSASEAGGGTVPPPAQYDLITDLLDANMFKVYADMLKSDKHTIVGIQVR